MSLIENYENLQLLNLDASMPSGYTAQETLVAASGAIRFIGLEDVNGLAAITRLTGDLLNRMKILETRLNTLTYVLKQNPSLAIFDNGSYVMTDGTHPLTQPLDVPNPSSGSTGETHAVNRRYLELVADALEERIAVLEGTTTEEADPVGLLRYTSDWLEVSWTANVKELLSFTVTPILPALDLNKIIGLTVAQRLDVALADAPTPNYIYRVLSSSGTRHGYTIDDVWVEPPNTVKVVIPNKSLYPTGYDTSLGYESTTTFRKNELRIVVLTEPPANA
jgi:hypothetical protein